MTEDGWQNARHLNLCLKTRTRYLTAETRDLKVFLPPADYPVSGFPLNGHIPATCRPMAASEDMETITTRVVRGATPIPAPTPIPCGNYLCPFLRSGPRGFWS